MYLVLCSSNLYKVLSTTHSTFLLRAICPLYNLAPKMYTSVVPIFFGSFVEVLLLVPLTCIVPVTDELWECKLLFVQRCWSSSDALVR